MTSLNANALEIDTDGMSVLADILAQSVDAPARPLPRPFWIRHDEPSPSSRDVADAADWATA